MNKFFKNASTLMIANALSFLISTLVTLFVPKLMTGEDYGYFQLYLFYINFLGFFCIGWIDGIVLRYGGKYYDDLEKPVFSRQLKMYALLELFFSLVVIAIAFIYGGDNGRRTVYFAIGIAIFLVQVNAFFRYLRQAVNDVDLYAKNVILEKVLYFLGVIITLVTHNYSFVWLLVADLIGKTISLIHMVIVERKLIVAPSVSFKAGIPEAKANVSAGIKLLLANGSSLLIIGIIRESISQHWNVETFGKVSLSLSISNMFILFVQAIGVSLFPMLKRISKEKLVGIYSDLRKALTIVMFSLLVVYYPIYVVLSLWLPKYAESLKYLAIMFPICIFESKMQLLIEPYLKSLRKEARLLAGNVVAIVLSCTAVLLCVLWLNNLDATVLSIVIILAIRSIILERVVEKELNIGIGIEIIKELVITVLFIAFNWFVGGWIGFALYLGTIIVYDYFERKDIKTMTKSIKAMVKGKN